MSPSENEMKKLLLLRHAKSSWKDSGRDFDRPLNKRGSKDAELIGKFIRTEKIHPDLIISSAAERARQTAELVVKTSGLKVELRFDERIYEASVPRLLEVIAQIEDTADTAMLIGHNPGFAELLQSLTGEARDVSTATLACIELNVEKWSRGRAAAGNLKWLTSPKELKE
jgi:phosphohistidine phosphatase